MPVIAMTREMATLGQDVAAGLAERLGLRIVHHELVEREIAGLAGLPESQVQRFISGQASLLERWRFDPKKLSRYTAQEILELVAGGNVLIRGWGATYLLRNLPHVVCVRICAPMPFRTEVLMKRLGITDPVAARREIERNDGAHNGTMQRLFGIDWTDPALYAITLNTERVPVGDCVEHIARICDSERFRETPEARAAVMDQVVEMRVRGAITERYQSAANAIGIDVKVQGGRVALSGAMTDERLMAEILRLAHGVPGVQGVENRMRHVGFSRE